MVSSKQFVENEFSRITKKMKIQLETNVHLSRGVANDCLLLLDIVARDEGKGYEAGP